MSTSIAIIGVGFLIAWLGVIMVYISLQSEPAQLEQRHLGFLNGPFAKANDSRRLIKFVIILGIIITASLYAASWMGVITW